MNRTLIEWTMYTWNVIVGCLTGCPFCYARRQAKRFKHRCQKCYLFEPHFHAERLEEPLRVKKPSKIFVCSMGEPFGPWVPREWINQILNIVRRCSQHIFQFLTKSPAGAKGYTFPANCWIGTSVDRPEALGRIDMLREVIAPLHFVSFEPLLGPIGVLDLRGIDWVIIGAQTGPRAVKPDARWIAEIIAACRHASVPVFLKNNLRWPERVQEWPAATK